MSAKTFVGFIPSINWRRLLPLALAGVLVLFCLWAGLNFLRPWWDDLDQQPPRATAWMAMRQEQWREKGLARKCQNKWVPYERISPYLVQALLIAEDDKFFSHAGFDWDMIQQAFERNLSAGRLKYGASTISQQLAKNIYLSPDRSLLRKVQEGFITLGLEAFLEKRRILELYLNLVEWGPGLFGAEAAARHYFGRPAAELRPWQAARLAAVLPKPLGYDPRRPDDYVVKRAARILAEMRRRGLGVIWE